ncbi:uncharacterized protein LOC141630964 [Silene latifolia]|uniref:uncharacterized protein LOC141630964 n=1 Tax=Silene latifolia TaxID=37657 RepID=UPI003D78A261
MPRSHGSELVPFNSEPEKTFRARRNFWKEIHQAEDLSTLDAAYTAFVAENQSLEEDTSTSAPTTIMATLASHSEPTLASLPKGFKLPTTDNGTFEIRPSYINLVERNMFGGAATKDPVKHMEKFVTYCCSIPLTVGVTQDQVKQVLFPFSLRDGAAEWLRDLDMEANAITDWNTLALEFYKRYFPPQKTNALRSQITSFKQGPTEDLNEAWVRFKRLVRSVPHHGFPIWFLCNQVYNGLYDDHRALLDSSANGRFQNNTTDATAWKLIDEIATHTDEYGNPRELKTTRSLGNQQTVYAMTQHETPCERCGIAGHGPVECMSPLEQVHAFQSFKQGTPYSNFYNERTREHPNFSYRSQNVLNPTPPPPQGPNQTYTIPQNRGNQPQGGYQRNNQGGQQHPNNDLSDIKAMLQQQMTASQKQEALITQLMAHNKMLDNQIAQLATSSRQPGTLPSQPEKSHDTANAIHLRSGLTYDGPAMPENVEEVIMEELDVDAEEKAADEAAVPSYAKFMKDILTRKRNFNEVETIAFTEECSALLQSKSPPKLKDPGSFSISCTIGTHVIDKALCDLGASVTVMPYSVCEKLNMGHLKVTNVTLQMADRTVKRPLGVLEDVSVKIGKFFIPVDFIVLDMTEDSQIPIILGRPFLHTVGAIIDVKKGRLTLEVGDDRVTFNLASTLAKPMIEDTCYAVDIVDESMFDYWTGSLLGDPLEALIALDDFAEDEQVDYETMKAL